VTDLRVSLSVSSLPPIGGRAKSRCTNQRTPRNGWSHLAWPRRCSWLGRSGKSETLSGPDAVHAPIPQEKRKRGGCELASILSLDSVVTVNSESHRGDAPDAQGRSLVSDSACAPVRFHLGLETLESEAPTRGNRNTKRHDGR
jgi:hypothetical protein